MASLVSSLKDLNAKRWAASKLTRAPEYVHPRDRILAAKNRYELIQRQTGVHWVFVACSHYRESSLNFATQLGQGDPLNRVSVHVPKGRGPFETFEQGAYDALVRCDPKAALNPIWKQPSIMPDMLTLLEMYNGLGYARKGIPSPYVWSGTDQYVRGKYVRDGVFDPNTVDKQLGVAGLILALQKADQSISFGKLPIQPEAPKTSVQPSVASTAPIKPEPKIIIPEVQKGPILNKEGEDITDHLHEFFHSAWEWLREH